MNKINKKVFVVLMLVLTLFSSSYNIIFAQTEINSAGLYMVQGWEPHLQYWNADKGMWYYVTTNYIGYNYNGRVLPAYCMNKELPGVDEQGDYTVNITELLSDVRIWRVIVNGFPYKSASELGVANDLDAYTATKQAIYSVLYNRENVESFYHGGDYRGECIVNAIVKLVNIGRYGSQTPTSANLKINKVGNLQEEPLYYTQEYSVSSSVRIDRYNVTSTVGLPNGAYIADIYGNGKTNFSGAEHFKVMIPKDKMVTDISSSVFVQAKCETYPIFYRNIAKLWLAKLCSNF